MKLPLYSLTAYLLGMMFAVMLFINEAHIAALTSVPLSTLTLANSTTPDWIFIGIAITLILFTAFLFLKAKEAVRSALSIVPYLYIFISVLLLMYILMPFLFGLKMLSLQGFVGGIFIALGITLFYRNKEIKVKYFNAFALLIAVGGIIELSQLGLYTLIIFMAIIAIYDYIAVFITKHMQKLAKIALTSENIIPLLIIDGDASKLAEKIDNPNSKEGKRISGLGLGDIIIPGGLLASIAVSQYNIYAVPLAFFATAGILLSMLLSGKLKHAIPAIPVIGFTMLLGYALLVILL
jgi:presenilin-like A22 family membrane protease